MRSTPAIVIGGGLIGCAVARALALDGWGVVVLERNREAGAEASSAAAGLLAPQTEWALGRLSAGSEAAEEALLALLLESRARFPAFARVLEERSGRPVHYRGEGSLVAALTVAEAAGLAGFAGRQANRGLRAEWVQGDEARRLEPALGPAVEAALLLPDDHQVDNVELTRAAVDAARAEPRLELRTCAPVAAIGARDGRVAGVRLADGTELDAGLVVLAAGAWSGGLGGLPRPIPVRPVKGQMIAVAPAAGSIRRTVSVPGAYGVPRDDGRVLIGATVEEAGFDTTIDEPAVGDLVAAAAAALPGLATAPVVARWAGFRPGTPDGLPILGADPDLPGLVYATGHFRNGILLAPLTAAVVAAVARGDAPPVGIAPFSPVRAALAPAPPARAPSR